jgi:diguanylate cyclase (GGDEF)-like protein/PAS domain S-box-containing protein
LAAGLRKWALQPIGSDLEWLTFYPAVMIAAIFSGLYAGVLATVLSCIVVILFWPFGVTVYGGGSFNHWFGLTVFAFNGIVVSGVAEAVLRARERAVKAQDQSQAAAQEHVLFENSPTAMVSIEPTLGRIIRANQVALKLFGCDAEEMLRCTVAELTHPADRAELKQHYEMLSSGQVEHLRFEKRYLRKDGTDFWAETSVSALRDTHGKVKLFIGNAQDITERKRTSQILNRECEKNALLLHNASDGIHILDAKGELIETSDSFCAMLGYRRDEMIGMNVSRWDAQWSDKELPDLVRERHLTAGRSQFETKHRRKDGILFDAEISVFPLELDGHPVLFCSSRDITERKKSEAEVQIAAIAFESQEGMLITDVNGTILRVNRAFTEITGYTSAEVIGKNPRMLSSGRQDASFYQAMWKSIHDTDTWKGEIWNRRKNGQVYPEYLTITAVKNVDGIVTNYVATLTDITLRKSSEEEIRNLAFYDHLTRLPNRRLLTERLRQAMSSSARNGRQGALLFIDLDNFKTLNDTLGHGVGDMLLQQVAERLIACVREGDSVARIGGDEFVVMLEDLSEFDLEAAAQTESVGGKVLFSLCQPYQLPTQDYHGSSSLGATLFRGHEQGIEDLLKQADIAMYQAKKAGRNTLRFFDPQMQESVSARAALEGELRLAIERRSFRLYYQIQTDAFKNPTGAEALIRWVHPERGIIAPERFISLSEETGLILPIGKWVLEAACAQLQAWQLPEYTRNFVLSVNISARQFRQMDFARQVQTCVQYYGINPAQLKFELTESTLLENIEDTIATMNALKKIGVQISLDDFGTGYSSLQYLKRLPLNQLKIDQSFVRDIAVDSSDKAIVRTIVAMAQSLNLDVIAEGVETEEQRQFLFSTGCTHYQGYLFGVPLPIEEFEEQLKTQQNIT